jgi:penicillin-binding protein 1A
VADRASFYQLKTILQGVVARGTARAIASLSPYVAGKTGTTEDSVDGWFVGFTNDVTVAVWVGYDNGDGKRRSLGPSEDGARVALPIFEPIIQAIWADNIAPKQPLSGPSPEAQRDLVDMPIDYMSGDRVNGGNFIEHFRRGADGNVDDTQYQMVSREDAYASPYPDQQWGPNDQGYFWGGGQGGYRSDYYQGGYNNQGGYNSDGGYNNQSGYSNQGGYRADGSWSARGPYDPRQGWQQPAPPRPPQPPPPPIGRGLFNRFDESNDPRQSAPGNDPNYFWGGR